MDREGRKRRRSKHFSVVAVLSAVLAMSQAGAETAGPGWVRDFDTVLATRLARSTVPAMAVALVEGGNVIWARGYGLADTMRKVPSHPIQCSGSVDFEIGQRMGSDAPG